MRRCWRRLAGSALPAFDCYAALGLQPGASDRAGNREPIRRGVSTAAALVADVQGGLASFRVVFKGLWQGSRCFGWYFERVVRFDIQVLSWC